MNKSYDAIIIGAGVSGLIAAKELEEYHLNVLVVEADSKVGGRLKTDHFDGYQLDHGFQVLLSAYPMVKKHLNLEAMGCEAFSAGAYCFDKKGGFEVLDVNRSPSAYLSMLFSPVGSFADKLKMAKLRSQVLAKSEEEIFNDPETTTLEFLQKFGFSDRIINRFFRPFFGGIFLETDLATSSRQFQFIFKMFALGQAMLPEKGIEAVAHQLKDQLKKTEFRFNSKVKALEGTKLKLEDGSEIEGQQVIIAGDPSALMPQYESDVEWNFTHQLYFKGPRSGNLSKKLIALSTDDDSIINNIACLSAVQKNYAPKDNDLFSVSLKGQFNESDEELAHRVTRELQLIIGSDFRKWELLRSFRVKKALPKLQNLAYERPFEESRLADGIYIAGDHLLNPSLNAAMLSGESAAKALILNHQEA